MHTIDEMRSGPRRTSAVAARWARLGTWTAALAFSAACWAALILLLVRLV